jgi:hypothetical protein
MALANPLALMFSAMSVAHAFNDIFEMRALIYPAVEFNKKRNLKAPAIDTAPAFHYKYAEGLAMVHMCVHALTICSLIWSLVSTPDTRTLATIALVFDVLSLAVAPLLLSVMEEIFEAKTATSIQSGLEKCMRRQLLRNASLHIPCMLCCLSAVMKAIEK